MVSDFTSASSSVPDRFDFRQLASTSSSSNDLTSSQEDIMAKKRKHAEVENELSDDYDELLELEKFMRIQNMARER